MEKKNKFEWDEEIKEIEMELVANDGDSRENKSLRQKRN